LSLKKELGFFQGLALYLSAVLGTGILVIPSLAFQEAGPASLFAWGALACVGFALAWSFAAVGAEQPNAGGVQSMIGRVLGSRFRHYTSWLVMFSIPFGGVAAGYILGNHLVVAANLPSHWIPGIAWGSLALVGALNYFGLRISANLQLLLSGVLIVLLVALVLVSLPHVQEHFFHPFSTNGVAGVGQSAILIFWSFLGWEAIAHLAEEFKNPANDMLRAAWTAAFLVGILYLAVSFVLIGTGSMGGESSEAPMAALAGHLFGSNSERAVAWLASVICLGTMNVYAAGLSRLAYAMSRDGSLPKWIGRLDNKTQTPRYALFFLMCMYTITILVKLKFDLPMRVFFLIPNCAFLTLYTLGCYCAGRLLQQHRKAQIAAYVSSATCFLILPFAAKLLFYPALLLGLAWLYLRFSGISRDRDTLQT
jgi:amino acid efflux transporter